MFFYGNILQYVLQGSTGRSAIFVERVLISSIGGKENGYQEK